MQSQKIWLLKLKYAFSSSLYGVALQEKNPHLLQKSKFHYNGNNSPLLVPHTELNEVLQYFLQITFKQLREYFM